MRFLSRPDFKLLFAARIIPLEPDFKSHFLRSSSSEQPRIISEVSMERYHLLRPFFASVVKLQSCSASNGEFAGESPAGCAIS
jgi:hypothetical protein